MKILAISASNIQHSGDHSASFLACRTIEKIIRNNLKLSDTEFVTIRLAEAELSPCTGCLRCFRTTRCDKDDVFNNLYSKVADSDAVFIVSPHYAPIPAKLCMLLEKMEQISFLHLLHDNNYHPPVYGIPVGLIAHGGGAGEFNARSYKAMVLDTIANALATVMMDVVGLNKKWPNGVVFPPVESPADINDIVKTDHDWDIVEKTITPLVIKVIEKADLRIGR